VSKTPAQRATPAKTAAKKTAAPARAKAAPAPKPAAKKAPAVKTPAHTPARPAAPAKSSPKARPPAAAPVPAPAPAAAPRPSPAKASFADTLAARTPPQATMNKSHAVLDQPRTAAAPADPKLANAWKTKAGKDLTDAEVLAMPDSEYMSDKQLEFFRHKLQTLKEDLLSNAGETTEHLREDTSIVPDPADRATIEEEHALELRTRDRERKLLKKIAHRGRRLRFL
jgi:DnaK suppressor protein